MSGNENSGRIRAFRDDQAGSGKNQDGSGEIRDGSGAISAIQEKIRMDQVKFRLVQARSGSFRLRFRWVQTSS